MAKQLKIGDKVKIKKGSEYFGRNTATNPAGVEGVVLSVEAEYRPADSHTIRVQWPNGTNSYRRSDLKLAKPKAPKENLLAEIIYKDSCGDFIEVDTEMSGEVYFRSGNMDGDVPEFDRTVIMSTKQVKKVRKQLKAWLDKHHSKA